MKPPIERITCPACAGRGGEADMYDEFDDCPLCEGAGQVARPRAEEWLAEDDATARALAAWTAGAGGKKNLC